MRTPTYLQQYDRSGTFNMGEVEHATWERIIIFMTVCTDHGRCNGPETIRKLYLAVNGARRETPIQRDTNNNEPITNLTGSTGLGHGGNVKGGKIRPSTRNVLPIEGGGGSPSRDPPGRENWFDVGLRRIEDPRRTSTSYRKVQRYSTWATNLRYRPCQM